MLKVLVFMPVLGAVAVALLPVARALWLWRVAMFFALATLGYALWLAAGFDPAGPAIQFHESRPWNVRLGSYFALGIDGIALAMVLLAALLSLIAVLVSRRMEAGARLYFTLVLLLESAMLGVFTARDWSLFYVFWEATLLPLFFLIDRLGGPNRQRAALNFFLYTLGGSVFMLVSLLFLYDAAPGHSFAMGDMADGGRDLPLNTQLLIFAGLFIGFGVKMPVFPLHGWLPLAHVEAPSPVSILLSGVLLKMGAYGLIRAAETLPAALLATQDWLALLAFVSLLYGGILAWRQQDLKAMVAYSSISHTGVVLLGIATFQAVAHRAADAYIDTEAIRLTARQAAWRLGEGLPADEALAIAKFWAAEGAHRVTHAAQHLHGGIGVDADYPVHRTFRWARHLELSLGGGTVHLQRLGLILAAG